MEEIMKKGQKKVKRYVLGDLVVALFEETKKVTSSKIEQKILVYAALKDLLKGRIHSAHPIALRIS